MKKLIFIFCLLWAGLNFTTFAGSSGIERISGPTTSCHNRVESYRVFPNSDDCFHSIVDVEASNAADIDWTPFDDTFTVRWRNTGSSNKTGTIDVIFLVEPDCNSSSPTVTKSTSLNVTIQPDQLTVARPNSIGTEYIYDGNVATGSSKYKFSTSSPDGATGFVWTVSGGTKITDNGSYIEVRPHDGSCQLNVGVKAKKTSCTGRTFQSNSRSLSYNISIPSNSGTISGDPFVHWNATPGIEMYTVSKVSGASSYEWWLDNPSSRWKIGTTFTLDGEFSDIKVPDGRYVFVQASDCCGSSNVTLKVRAKNSCGESLSVSSYQLKAIPAITLPLVSNKGLVYPNPAKIGQEIRVSNIDQNKIVIQSISGEVVDELQKGSSITDLKPGIYLIDIYTNDGILHEKLIVE